MITNAIRWCFVDVFDVIIVLRFATPLVEKLLILSVVVAIILTRCNVAPIVPLLLLSASSLTHFYNFFKIK